MPKPSFTAGPWKLYRPEGFAILSEDAIIGIAHHGKERAAIDTRVISEDEANANARLIAAAPELLEALRRLVEYEMPLALTGPVAQRWGDAVAAIARAQGSQA